MQDTFTSQNQAHDQDGDWLESLKAVADMSDKAKTARLLGYSRTAVSLALSGKYPAKTDKLEAAVRHTFMRPILPCPALDGAPTSVASCCSTQACAERACPDTCPALALNQNQRVSIEEARHVA